MNPNPTPNLKLIRDVLYGYLDVDTLWGRTGSIGRGIEFTDSGMQRAASIMGFIVGAAEYSGREKEAELLARNFCSQMDYLSNYGGKTHEHNGFPGAIVQVFDDGGLHSFGLNFMLETPRVPEAEGDESFRSRSVGFSTRWYRFAFNGGLIYHRGIPLAEDKNQWEVHT